ncbi:MAG: transcription factor S [Candidatus Thorarchaeota archaeon]|nr:MAG: transcription factor S [Candidatus Thorarchaeota archaeon]RLI56190.1 MAG: transcription factor S [Candidatus Thorarchaeota archaeon]RLI62489.1 MAG: transcription factor S [Candidatus Thorarchaeota archaeon]
MEFCDKCGAMMVPVTSEDGTRVLKCRSCGHTRELKGNLRVSHKIKKSPRDKIVVVEDDSIPMPVTKATCPKCGNNEAYYWTVQTRRGDEGATEFYRCTRCKYTWREYGG